MSHTQTQYSPWSKHVDVPLPNNIPLQNRFVQMDIENPVAETFAGCMHLAAEIVAYSAAATIITLFRSIFEVGQNQFE